MLQGQRMSIMKAKVKTIYHAIEISWEMYTFCIPFVYKIANIHIVYILYVFCIVNHISGNPKIWLYVSSQNCMAVCIFLKSQRKDTSDLLTATRKLIYPSNFNSHDVVPTDEQYS